MPHLLDTFETYRPTMRSSLCLADGRIRLHTSIVKTVLALLNIDVSELIIADSMTAINNPRAPEQNIRK